MDFHRQSDPFRSDPNEIDFFEDGNGIEKIPSKEQQRYRRLLPTHDTDGGLFATTSTNSNHVHIRTPSSTTDRTQNRMSMNRTKRFSTMMPASKFHYKSDSNGDEIEDETDAWEAPVGQEPGVDVDTMHVDLPDSIGSQITVIDYSTVNCRISHYDVEKDGDSVITGSNRREMVQKHLEDVLHERPKWAKVRWIVVNGLSWEAIKPIAVYYNLHPLAVEDMLDIPQRTKMEIFEDQLFCCYPLHVLNVTKTPYSFLNLCLRHFLLAVMWIYRNTMVRPVMYISNLIKERHKSRKQDLESNQTSHFPTETKNKQLRFNVSSSNFSSSSLSSKRGPSSQSDDSIFNRQGSLEVEECIPFYTVRHGVLCGDAYSSPVAEKIRQTPARSIYDWNQGNHLLRRMALQNMHIPGTPNSHEITHEQVSLFMVNDSVISFFEKSGPEIYGPLENRLKSHDTMLRQSSDPAILVQAILDASVDLLGPILNAYRLRLNRLQVQSVQQPNLHHTRALHAFMTDLTILRPPISSLSNIVSGLWQKCTATRRHGKTKFEDSTETLSDNSMISDVAALYFGDVADHALRYLEDIDDMRNLSRTLSSLIFNTISIHGSDYMKMLSLVSVVFLPLTFLTGYFGMNFKTFTILDHDVAYYWVIAAPAAAALCAVVMYSSTKYQVMDMWARAKSHL